MFPRSLCSCSQGTHSISIKYEHLPFPVLEQWAFTEEEHQGQFNLLGYFLARGLVQGLVNKGAWAKSGPLPIFYTAHKLRMFLTNEFLQSI